MTEPQKISSPDVLTRQMDQISIRDLRILCLISELGTVSAAAKTLEISQPSVSYSLDKARKIFDDNLFISEHKKLIPTDVCQRLIYVADSTVQGIKNASIPKDSDTRYISGEVVILKRNNNWRLFHKISERFFEAAPNARLQILTTDERDTDAFLERQCDLFIGAQGLAAPNVYHHTITGIPCAMIFDPANVTPPATIEEFANHRFAVTWSKIGLPNKGIGVVDQALVDKGLMPRTISYKSPCLSSVADMLKQTDLIYTGAMHSLPKDFVGLSHAPLPFETNPFTMSVRWMNARMKNPLAALALDLTIEVLEEEYAPNADNLVTTPYLKK